MRSELSYEEWQDQRRDHDAEGRPYGQEGRDPDITNLLCPQCGWPNLMALETVEQTPAGLLILCSHCTAPAPMSTWRGDAVYGGRDATPTLRAACEQGFARLDALTAALAGLIEPAPWLEDLVEQVAALRDLFDAALTADDLTHPTAEERAALAAAARDALIVAAHATWSALDEQRSRDARVMSPRLRQAQDDLGAAVRKAKGDRP